MVGLEVDEEGEEKEKKIGIGKSGLNGDVGSEQGVGAKRGGSSNEREGNRGRRPMRLRAPGASSIKGIWRWLWTTLRVPDSMVFRIYGIDVWSYLQFLKFCVAVFFVLSIVGVVIYLPVNMTGGNHMKGFNSTGMGNLPPGDKRAYVHLVGVYVVTFFITFLAFKFFKQFTRYRQRYKKLALLNNFSCMVTNVPLAKGITTSAKLQAFFEKLYPNQVASATLIFNLKPLERKIKDRQAFIEALDRAIAQYQNSGIRPLISLKSVAGSLSQRDRDLFGLPPSSSLPDDALDGVDIPPRYNGNLNLGASSEIEDDGLSVEMGRIPTRNNFNSGTSRNDHRRREEEGEESMESHDLGSMSSSDRVVHLDGSIDLESMDSKERRQTLKSPSRFKNCFGLFGSCSKTKSTDYMVDAMLWYQHQIDDLDEEIELERRRVEESEDLQEAVPLVMSTSDATKKHPSTPDARTHPSSISSQTPIGINSIDDMIEGEENESDSVSPSTPAKSVPGHLGNVLWRLSKKLQPDREEDEEILNEPFEQSDIPPEADPSIASLSDHERRILATSTALLDPRHVAPESAIESSDSQVPSSASNLVSSSGSSESGAPEQTIVPSTPTMEAAKARRLTRSMSRLLVQPTRSATTATSSITQVNMPPTNSSSLEPGTSASSATADGFAARKAFAASRTQSGSLTHLPVVQTPSSTSSASQSSHSKHRFGAGEAENFSSKKKRAHQHGKRGEEDYFRRRLDEEHSDDSHDSEDDDDEEQESIFERLMIRVPGVESLRKMWRNWVVGAPKVVVGEDGLLRRSVYRPTTTGFVTFKTIVAANHCANSGYLSKSFFKWRVEFAPAETDVLWRNIRLGWWQQWIRYLIMIALVCLLIIFWGVPVGFISQWANLEHLQSWSWSRRLLSWLRGLVGDNDTNADEISPNSPNFLPASPGVSPLMPTPFSSPIPSTMSPAVPAPKVKGPGIIDSVVARLSPTLTLLIFMNLLVPVIRVLFDYVERPPTKSGQETKVFRVYYAFLLFNVLFLSTLTSQISNLINQVVRNPSNTITDLARHLGETLPSYGAFFINYILNSSLLTGALGLPRIMFFAIHFIFLKRAKSPAEVERVKREAVGGFEYDFQYAAHLNIFTIALAYSSMVPLILPTALLYFMLWFTIDKYNLIFAYSDNFDRAGIWTPLVFRRVFAAIAIYHFTMFGTFLVKQNYFASGLLLPMFIFDLIIHWYAINTFAHRSQFVPLDEATRYPHTAYQLGLEDGYVHPAMHDIPDSLYVTRYDTNLLRQNIAHYKNIDASGERYGTDSKNLKNSHFSEPSNMHGGLGNGSSRSDDQHQMHGDQNIALKNSTSRAMRFHPSLTRDSNEGGVGAATTHSSTSASTSTTRKRVARSLEDELGLEEQH